MNILGKEVLGVLFLAILVWVIYALIKLLVRRFHFKRNQNNGIDPRNKDYGEFLEILLDSIVVPEKNYQNRDLNLRRLSRKIHSFKRRNYFYRDIDFNIGKDIDDFMNTP